jgi:7,8-dihydropterin-6-yl-methyl-4-(beta-D-ribofuranosyl)aminobenzene 5'-phosphate synthase
MPALKVLDKLVVDVLMDNLTDSYSTKLENVSPEFNNVIDAGASEISGSTLCCAQLGLSLMLQGYSGGVRHKLLFDAGPEGSILIRNCKSLGVELHDVEEIAISHGHWDHMGGLLSTLDAITKKERMVACHVNPGMFLERACQLSDGRIVPFEKVPSPEQLSSQGATVVNDAQERELLDGYFYLSGEIPRVTSFEHGREDHLGRHSESEAWTPDPFLMDERYLAVNIRSKGLVIFSSCSHAGIVNVLFAARDRFPNTPIYAVFGGLHLVGKLEQIIPETVSAIKKFAPAQIIPAHCTGWRAQYALLQKFGPEIVSPSAVGSRYTF